MLQRPWGTRNGQPNPYRVRSLAVLAVALAAPPGTTTIALASMLPKQVRALRIPRAGWRWVKRWFRIRSECLPGYLGEESPWVALPPMSRGMPRMIDWGIRQTLHRGGAPAWSLKALLRASVWERRAVL